MRGQRIFHHERRLPLLLLPEPARVAVATGAPRVGDLAATDAATFTCAPAAPLTGLVGVLLTVLLFSALVG
ncbi:MAG: hypothetical protein H0X24_25130 [Ktedonobacterales bacterium]|nr:hypothetical protein [Ktedonobacterales bacterium]